MREIKKVVVIGAGVMGSGIAAQLANSNTPVLLLDIPVEGGRNKLAADALERMKKQKPAPFMDPQFASRITVGNTEDDLAKIKDYDWVIEAIIEKLEAKQDLYGRMDEICGGKIIVSSNTSSIRLQDLIAGRSEGFQKSFFITHFFNPPRYMRLLELVTSDKTDKEAISAITRFADERMGKSVVFCHDTPAFIANRIGVYVSLRALDEACRSDLSITDIDALFTKAYDIPKTGIFALFDLVGLDVMYLVGKELVDHLPKTDPVHQMDTGQILGMLKGMIDKGYTGRKGLGGFYRLKEEGGQKIKEAMNLKTGEYAVQLKPQIPGLDLAKKDLKAFLSQDTEAARFAWAVMSDALHYAASLVPEITDEIIYVDRAIRLGFNWKLGPFEMMDKMGPAWVAEKMKASGKDIPKLLQQVGDGTFYKVLEGKRNYLTTTGSYKPIERPEGVLKLKDIKDASQPIIKNESACLWDLGDGVACFEFTTKQNTFDLGVMDMINKSIDVVQSQYKALVFFNETDNFSLGANLHAFMAAASGPDPEQASMEIMESGQLAYKKLKFAPFPAVGAPVGMTLGGGCELNLHCDAIVAHAELYMGLVEMGVGIIPGWGGCKEMLLRAEESAMGGALIGFRHVFETIGTARVSTSAFDAQRLMFLRKTDTIVMNRDRVLFEAKKRALSLVAGYKPPEEKRIKLPGRAGLTVVKMALSGLKAAGKMTAYDMVVAEKLGYILTGGPTDILHKVSEQQLFDLELQTNKELSQNQGTRDRIMHFVTTGKPLRN
jgi:3-hydroxyacyl-CoA dehydrogenase